MNPGDVRLVLFPFSDREAAGDKFKKRPVLVLREVAGRPEDQVTLVAMITSNQVRWAAPHAGDVKITTWQAAGLRYPSVVRTRRLWTAENRDFTGRVLGSVGPAVLAAVMAEVRQLVA